MERYLTAFFLGQLIKSKIKEGQNIFCSDDKNSYISSKN